MAKWASDTFLDQALDYLKTNATKMFVCSAQPANYSEASSTYALADTTVSSTDWTKADDTSGRKLTFGGKSGVTVDTTGSATHIAICTDDTLIYVTTTTTKSLTASDLVNVPEFKINIQDPS